MGLNGGPFCPLRPLRRVEETQGDREGGKWMLLFERQQGMSPVTVLSLSYIKPYA